MPQGFVSVRFEIDMQSLRRSHAELRLDPVYFIADRISDLPSELDQKALECLRSVQRGPGCIQIPFGQETPRQLATIEGDLGFESDCISPKL